MHKRIRKLDVGHANSVVNMVIFTDAFTFISIHLRLAFDVNLTFIQILTLQKYSSYKLKTFKSWSLVIIHQCMYRHKPKYLSLACKSQDLHMHIDQGRR